MTLRTIQITAKGTPKNQIMPPTTEHEIDARKKTGRSIFWVIAAVSLAITIISAILLAGRIDRYNKAEHHEMFAYIDVTSPAFAYKGRAVEFMEETIEGDPYLRVRYGDEVLGLPVAVPPKYQLPTLFDRQKDWMKMLFFADRAGMTFDEFQQAVENGTIHTRLIIVTRTPFGFEPPKEKRFANLEHEKNWAWGEVRRDQWRFDFYEFMPNGTILHHEPKRFPESGKSLLRRQNNAKLKGEPIPQRGEHDLQEYTWEYGAALSVSPRAPAITFEKQALRGAGWTLPVASGSFLLMIVAFFFAIAPPRTQQ